MSTKAQIKRTYAQLETLIGFVYTHQAIAEYLARKGIQQWPNIELYKIANNKTIRTTILATLDLDGLVA